MIVSPEDKVWKDLFRMLTVDKKEKTESEVESEYGKFMGDTGGRAGHNRELLAYFAGLPDDRMRLLAMQEWSIAEHMGNTSRASFSEKVTRYGITVTILGIGYTAAIGPTPWHAIIFVAAALVYFSVWQWAKLVRWVRKKLSP